MLTPRRAPGGPVDVDWPRLVAACERRGVPVSRVDERRDIHLIRTAAQLEAEWGLDGEPVTTPGGDPSGGRLLGPWGRRLNQPDSSKIFGPSAPASEIPYGAGLPA